ncbi:MAG: hypothetical protein JRG73_14550 [Deltaproteobacteria bacterium]|nr:hypothetical protein [Deltaproteobacteria bacterium]MBW2308144.1 hypothetical protein [Deltaproteobacteria bacterium]
MNDPITSREPNQEKRIRIRTKGKAEEKEQEEFLSVTGPKGENENLMLECWSKVFPVSCVAPLWSIHHGTK